jgi:hypothetical protein
MSIVCFRRSRIEAAVSIKRREIHTVKIRLSHFQLNRRSPVACNMRNGLLFSFIFSSLQALSIKREETHYSRTLFFHLPRTFKKNVVDSLTNTEYGLLKASRLLENER